MKFYKCILAMFLFSVLLVCVGCHRKNETDALPTMETDIITESEPSEDAAALIKEKAESLLDAEIDVFFNVNEKRVIVFYKNPQTQENVENAFTELKAYLKTIGFGNYRLNVGGNDGMPSVGDEAEATKSNPEFVAPTHTSYNCVGHYAISTVPLFEIVSTKEANESDGALIRETLKEELNGDHFSFYLVDENEVFLGSGSNNKYTPYVYTPGETAGKEPAYSKPFTYYFSKYFSQIECTSFECNANHGSDEFGRTICEYLIEASPHYTKESKEAAQKVLDAMDRTLGEKVKVVIRVYPNSKSEIRLEAPDPITE